MKRATSLSGTRTSTVDHIGWRRGMVTSTIHVLIVTPVIFHVMKMRALKKGRLRASDMAQFIKD